jgi:hypothetical protein
MPMPPGYAFLAQRLKRQGARELQSLSRRWLAFAPRWPIGVALLLLSPADLRQWQDLERDLIAWGRKHGRIIDPPPGLPGEPVAALRQAILHSRTALDMLQAAGVEHRRDVEDLLRLWRQRLPDYAPPEMPKDEDGQAALDRLQRALERLDPPRASARPLGSLPALKGTAKAALAIIRAQKGQGLSAKELAKELERKGIEVVESTLRRHILPKLIPHGIANDRARGGYYDARASTGGI